MCKNMITKGFDENKQHKRIEGLEKHANNNFNELKNTKDTLINKSRIVQNNDAKYKNTHFCPRLDSLMV